MNKIELTALIKSMTENTIFGCTFIKKDGTIRDMTCRLGVKKGLNGRGLNFDPVDKGLLPVYDMANGGFRMVNLSTLSELRIKGKTYTIANN
tara:strand:- start:306 stop:581 length:276 start_codon:yes stop_codon:yes gene_type:complete